jgi:hypothetical protein
MTARAYYRAATLLPLCGLAIAAWLRAGAASDLAPGWEWIYPSSVTRGLVAYALVAIWLWAELGRRPVSEISRLLWRAPLGYLAANWLLMWGLELARGRGGELWASQAGIILLRAAVHLLIGYGYVGLVQVTFRMLRGGGTITEAGQQA